MHDPMRMTKTGRRVTPGELAPELEVPLVGGGQWSLQATKPSAFTAVIFYRGRFCNICSRYLPSIECHSAAFRERGTDVIVISADDELQAAAAKTDWGLGDIPVGYDLTVSDMDAWGLFMSEADLGRAMAPIFCEPGLFLVKPDKTVFYAAINSAPFGRPSIPELLDALDFIAQREGGYPQRGGFRAAQAGDAY
jgi:peroxiredoxin